MFLGILTNDVLGYILLLHPNGSRPPFWSHLLDLTLHHQPLRQASRRPKRLIMEKPPALRLRNQCLLLRLPRRWRHSRPPPKPIDP